MPTVSVIIPTYNRSKYLKLTLQSILNQTFDDIEVIVVDDGSPNDEAETVCKAFDKVSYYKIENSGGPAKPRNYGLSKAKGKYIAFTDDDDIWLPNKLEQQVNILDHHSDYGLVHGYCDVIDEHGELTGEVVGRPGSPDVKHGDVKLKMIGNWTLMTATPLLRRTLIDKVGVFNEDMPPAGEDVEYWTRCSFRTKFYYLDKALVHYRIHSGNISASDKYYIDVPLYLKKAVKSAELTKEDRNLMLNSLSLSQAKYVKKNLLKTLYNLCIINPFWMLNFRVIKVMVKKLIS